MVSDPRRKPCFPFHQSTLEKRMVCRSTTSDISLAEMRDKGPADPGSQPYRRREESHCHSVKEGDSCDHCRNKGKRKRFTSVVFVPCDKADTKDIEKLTRTGYRRM